MYLPVVSLHGGSRGGRPAHLRRVDMTVIGTFKGEPVWLERPADQALCGTGELISTVREADCPRCLRQRDKQKDRNER